MSLGGGAFECGLTTKRDPHHTLGEGAVIGGAMGGEKTLRPQNADSALLQNLTPNPKPKS
jgi:hypothetical protein